MLKKNPLIITGFASANLFILVRVFALIFVLLPVGAKSQQSMFETGVISGYNSSGFVVSAYPVIDRLPNGRLVCIFSGTTDAKPSKTNIAVSTSDDNGRTWSKPQVLFNHPNAEEYDPNLLVDGDRILAFSTTVIKPGKIDSTNIYKRSSLDGRTWTNKVQIKRPHRYICGKIHQGHRLKDGSLIMGYSWDTWAEQGKPPETEGEMDIKSGVLRSTDGGETWSAGEDIYAEPKKTASGATGGMAEPATVVLADGRVMALLRAGGDKLYQTWSSDNGLSWEPPRPSGLTAHNSPAALWKLDNSPNVLVVWNDSPAGRNPLAVSLSIDGGKTWNSSKTIVNTGGPQASYPSAIQAKDGTIIVVWQQAIDKGREVRIARFNQAWLLSPD